MYTVICIHTRIHCHFFISSFRAFVITTALCPSCGYGLTSKANTDFDDFSHFSLEASQTFGSQFLNKIYSSHLSQKHQLKSSLVALPRLFRLFTHQVDHFCHFWSPTKWIISPLQCEAVISVISCPGGYHQHRGEQFLHLSDLGLQPGHRWGHLVLAGGHHPGQRGAHGTHGELRDLHGDDDHRLLGHPPVGSDGDRLPALCDLEEGGDGWGERVVRLGVFMGLDV